MDIRSVTFRTYADGVLGNEVPFPEDLSVLVGNDFLEHGDNSSIAISQPVRQSAVPITGPCHSSWRSYARTDTFDNGFICVVTTKSSETTQWYHKNIILGSGRFSHVLNHVLVMFDPDGNVVGYYFPKGWNKTIGSSWTMNFLIWQRWPSDHKEKTNDFLSFYKHFDKDVGSIPLFHLFVLFCMITDGHYWLNVRMGHRWNYEYDGHNPLYFSNLWNVLFGNPNKPASFVSNGNDAHIWGAKGGKIKELFRTSSVTMPRISNFFKFVDTKLDVITSETIHTVYERVKAGYEGVKA